MLKIILTVLLLSVPGISQATIYWDDEMEVFTGTGHFNPLPNSPETAYAGPGVPGTTPMTSVTDIKFSGNGSLRYNYTDKCQQLSGAAGSQPCGGSTSRNFGVYAPEHYGRVWMRVAPGWRWGISNGQSKLWGVRSTQGLSKLWFNFYFGFSMIVSAENTPNTGHTSNIPLNYTMPNNGTWNCVEWHIKANEPPGTPNGTLEFWANGSPSPTVSRQDVQWRGADNNSYLDFILPYRQSGGPYDSAPDGTVEHLWFDRMAVGSTRIGCGAGAPPPPPDTVVPTVPGNLAASAASSSQINLTWNASTDNVGVTGYRIFRSGAPIGTATGASYSNTGLSSSTAYSYTVAAYDAAGNASGQSAVVSTTTHAAATGAVGTVNNLSATPAGANSATLSFTEVTDGAGQPAKYDVRFSSSGTLWGGARSVTQGTCVTPLTGTTVGATKTCTVLGLSPSTAYQFQLIAFRGTIGAGAVYGALSNLAGASTSSAANVMPPTKPRNLRSQ